MKYRVKQIANDKFLPQVKKNFFSRWRTIDGNDHHLCNFEVFAKKHAYTKTLQAALCVIQGFKQHMKIKQIISNKTKTIYHYL